MTFGSEMSSIVRTLEILGSEVFIPDIDDTLRGVKKFEAVFITSGANGLGNLREILSVHVPRSYESDPRIGIFGFYA